MAIEHIPMTMKDWEDRLNNFLKLFNKKVLKTNGAISHDVACSKALTEFEKYRIKQDQIYRSDFDLLIEELEKK